MFSGAGPTKGPPRSVSSYLDEHLLNGGSREANVDGSVTPVEFSFTATRLCEINRMLIAITDSGTVTSDTYGALSTLTNEVEFEHVAADMTVTQILSYPIRNSDWRGRMYNFDEDSFSGGGSVKSLSGRWTFKAAGAGLWLHSGDSLVIRINDDLTGLTTHRFIIQGDYLE